MTDSLWGEEFSSTLQQDKQLVEKLKNKKPAKAKTVQQTVKSKSTDISIKLQLIENEVHRILGKYEEDTILLNSRKDLHEYIDRSIANGIIAIDTETNNSLDPISCKIMGGCIYTPGLKNAYIPINHVNRLTGQRLENQLTEQDLKEEFDRLADTKIVMHNGKFDYQVIKCTCNCKLAITWDTMIGAKLLDENELSAGLKYQYRTKIDPEQDKYDIEGLFQGVEYAVVDPKLFALYAATDSFITYKLYEWQKEQFEKPDNAKIYKLFREVEMPLVEVIAEMEMAGMEVDQDYAKLLSAKYHKKLDEVEKELDEELKALQPAIDIWRKSPDANFHPKKKTGEGEGKSKSEQLTNPINLASPTQLAILFYDVLRCDSVNKKAPRGTGEEEIKAINEKYKLPLCDLLLRRRECIKLLTTYIDIIPELAKRWKDGRVRTHFNQYGAQTGRLSSSDPLNFQNIPSHEKSIRMLFKSKSGYKIIGADYSAQEPRITAFISQDPAMIKAYEEGKDLYSVIAAMSFDRKYEDCLEFYPEGTVVEIDGKKIVCGHKNVQNKEGKTYRTYAKGILLGITYGMSAASVGLKIGKSKDEAQQIMDKFFNEFPTVRKLIEESKQQAKTLGYVEDVAGRRRRLPDAQLINFEVSYTNPEEHMNSSFNPLLGSKGLVKSEDDKLLDKYFQKAQPVKYAKELENLKAEALKEGVTIFANTVKIAQAERQSLNARIQGSAATLTKCALNSIYRDERLRKMGAYLINTVHDEILIEAPDEYSKEAEEYLIEDMINSAKAWVTNVPMSADCYNVDHWYSDEYVVLLQSEYDKCVKDKGMTESEAEQSVINNHSELLPNQILSGIHNGEIFNYCVDN